MRLMYNAEFASSDSGAMLSLAAAGERSSDPVRGRILMSKQHEVVVCYDHALSFGREVHYMWKPRFSSAVILFHVVRYAGVVEALVVAYNTVATVDDTESSLVR